MNNQDDSDVALLDDRRDTRLPRARKLLPRPPKKFVVQSAGNGVRVTVTPYDADSTERVGSSAISYLVYWAENVDMTTPTGIAQGFKRATLLAPAIPAPVGRRGQGQATGFFNDPKYLTGYFFCVGVDALGNASDPTNPVFIGSGTGGTIPPDVEHFQASQSGEAQNGTVLSVVSYSFRIPTSGGSIDHVQFFYKNYPNLNQTSEGQSVRITTGAGGTQFGQLKLPVGRRIGSGAVTISGTAVTGGGTNFLALAAQAGGDQIEVFGVRARIASVTSNTVMTLSSAWTGPTVTAVGEWQVIGSVTIYAVSESFTGARRSDVENAPSQTVDLDGLLGLPLAPALSLTDLANGIKVFVTPPAGTQIDTITLYKGKGSGLAFSACSPIFTWPQDKINSNPFLEYPDFDFTTYDKEQGTTFSYYADCRNVRGGRSVPSSRLEWTARLNSSQDVDPSLTGRVGVKNLLFNAMFAGTAGNVADTDKTAQHAYFGDFVAGTVEAGKPYGGSGQVDGKGRYQGYTMWHSTKSAGAPTLAQFQNGNEIRLPAPTAGNVVYVFSEIGAWDDGRAAFMKARKNGIWVWSLHAKKSGSPGGTFHILLEQYNNNTQTGWVPRRYRDSSSVLQTYTGSAAELVVQCTSLTTSWVRFYAVFIGNAALGTTKQLRMTFSHNDSTSGDVIVCQGMLNDGEDIGAWTADMGDPYVSHPVPGDPVHPIKDGDGLRSGRIQIP